MKTLARPHDRDELLRRVRTLRPDSARRWGRMSAHQVVCHLGDCFRMALGHRTVSRSRTLLPPTVLKWIALYLPLPWPPGIRTRPEVDQQGGGTAPTDFDADIAQLESLLALAVAPERSFEGEVHPTLGRLSDREWRRWAYLHMDHHLRQFGA